MFIETIPEDEAEGDTAALYDGARDAAGQIPNYVRAFSHRPGLMQAWDELLGTVKRTIDPRRYELATIAAARELRSSYCLLAHGSVLMRDEFTAEELRAVASDAEEAPLTEAEREIMRYAAKVAGEATSVGPEDIERLRAHGLSDPEIFDIAAAAAARAFFTKLNEAVGVQADARYAELDPDLRAALVIGRPIAE